MTTEAPSSAPTQSPDSINNVLEKLDNYTESIPGTRHEHPFLEDLIDDPSSPKLKDLKDNREKKQKGELYGNQEVVDNMDIVEGLLKNEELQTLFPRKDNESDTAYRTRLLNNLMGRLRFHGDYQVKKDSLYSYLQQNLKNGTGRPYHWDEVLMGAEALNALDIQERNQTKQKEYGQYTYNLNQSARRRSVLTEVDLLADERYPGGGLQPYFTRDTEGKLTPEKMPQADLAAFEVVGSILMDVEDATLGKKFDGSAYTYGEQFSHYQGIVLNPVSTQEQKDQASKRLASLRESYYVKTLDVLKHRDSHNPYREGEDYSAFGHGAYKKLYEDLGLLGKTPDQAMATLVDAYKQSYQRYHGRSLTPRQEERLKSFLSTQEQPGLTQDIMDLAIKGGESMRRRVKKLREPPKLEKASPRIFRKKFKEAGIYRGPIYVEETPVVVTPPEKEGEKKGKGEEETPEGAPTATLPGEKQEEKIVETDKIAERAKEIRALLDKEGIPNDFDKIRIDFKKPAQRNTPEEQAAAESLISRAKATKEKKEDLLLTGVDQIAEYAFSLDDEIFEKRQFFRVPGFKKLEERFLFIKKANRPFRENPQQIDARKRQWRNFAEVLVSIIRDNKKIQKDKEIVIPEPLVMRVLLEGSKIRNMMRGRLRSVILDFRFRKIGHHLLSEQDCALSWLIEQLDEDKERRDPELNSLLTRISSKEKTTQL